MGKDFCVMPWYSREINLVSSKESVCCWAEGNITRQELQKKIQKGQHPSECRKCWQSEQQGIESRRQMENRFLDFKMDRDISLLESDATVGTAQPNMYQLFVGSICNSTCVTCDSTSSSAWRSLYKKKESIKKENHTIDQNFKQLADTIDWSQAKRFNLLGGEPLLMARSFYILHKLLEAGNTDCRISFVSNGSVALTDEQIQLIKNFSDINVCLSIDGIEKSFEYIRYPLSWNRLLENLTSYRNIFAEVTVNFTVSNLNYYNRQSIIKWFKEQNLLYIETYVTMPPWFNFTVGPGHPLWSRFCQEIATQDRLKGISIKDYLPDVAKLIDLNSL